MSALPHRLTRRVLINAERETVFRFFTDSTLFAAWWGAGSTIDAHPGGRVQIRYPNAVMASGVVESVSPPEQIVFTYGYEDTVRGIAPGSTRVTVTLATTPQGTELTLTHEFGTATQRDQHDPGWRFQLSVFANVAARAQHSRTVELLDRWFAAWNETRAPERLQQLSDIAEPQVRFQDGFAALQGVDELADHIRAAQMHGAGTLIGREGAPRECQGTILVDWMLRSPEGQPRGRGTNFVALSPAGRISAVIGFPVL